MPLPKVQRWFLACIAESISIIADAVARAATEFADRMHEMDEEDNRDAKEREDK